MRVTVSVTVVVDKPVVRFWVRSEGSGEICCTQQVTFVCSAKVEPPFLYEPAIHPHEPHNVVLLRGGGGGGGQVIRNWLLPHAGGHRMQDT